MSRAEYALKWTMCWLALTLAGCGSVMMRYDQATSTAAIAASGCREVLSEAHEQKAEGVIAKANAGEVEAARADLERWKATYNKVRLACAILRATAEEALAMRPVVAASVSRDVDVASWIARLAALGLDTVRILADVGLKIPGGK